MGPAGGDRNGVGDPQHVHWGALVLRRIAVTELPGGVKPPTVHRAAVQESAGVVLPSSDGRGVGDIQYIRGSAVVLENGAVAELPAVVETPSLHRAPVQESAGVPPVSTGHRRHARAKPDNADGSALILQGFAVTELAGPV